MMTPKAVSFCRQCARFLARDTGLALQHPLPKHYILQPTAPFFFSKRWLAVKRPVLRLEPPDPNAPKSSVTKPVERDPGLTLGEHGIPVPRSPHSRRRDYTDERSWAETVYRTLSGGMKSDYIKCTELDEYGNVRVGMQAFKKVELCTMHGLLPRDLRKLEVGPQAISPSILVRKNSILVNLLHIRALVKADKVLVFDVMSGGDSHAQSIFMWDLEGKLRQGSKAMGGLPYELRYSPKYVSPTFAVLAVLRLILVNVVDGSALESILISVTTALDVEMAVLRKFVNELLTQLETDIDRERLRNMLIYSKKLSAFEKKATLIRDALAEILDNDEDLAGMYLTEKSRGRQRDVDQHDEVELLLEAYVKQVDGIVQEADQLVSNMRNTEEIVNIILDANRNSLMLLDLKVSMTTLGIGSGAAIAGLLGMNLKNFFEEWDYGFPVITSLAFGTSMLVCGYGLARLKRIQKLTLYGRYPGIPKRKDIDIVAAKEFPAPPWTGEEHMNRVKRWKMWMWKWRWNRL